jgi:hypothetical protein
VIEEPKLDEEVLIDEARGHTLPTLFEGVELPVRGVIVASPAAAENLWRVKLSEPLTETVQVHGDQLYTPQPARPPKEPAAHWTTDQMIVALLRRTVGQQAGVFGVSLKEPEGDWSVMVEYGVEAPDSPMAGAATYGLAGTLRGALMRAGADAGLWEYDDSPEPTERQQRILIVEAEHPAEMNVNAVQGSMTLLADADEAYVFCEDKATALKHRHFAPEDMAVAIQRRPVRTQFGPDLTITDRGRTLGPHIGVPLAHVEAFLAADAETATAQQEELVGQALDEMREFVRVERKA